MKSISTTEVQFFTVSHCGPLSNDLWTITGPRPRSWGPLNYIVDLTVDSETGSEHRGQIRSENIEHEFNQNSSERWQKKTPVIEPTTRPSATHSETKLHWNDVQMFETWKGLNFLKAQTCVSLFSPDVVEINVNSEDEDVLTGPREVNN